MMKLFVWKNTNCNKLYSRGDIVAMSPDLEAAKATVLEAAKTAEIGYNNMAEIIEAGKGEGFWAENCREDVEATMQLLRHDLATIEPEVHEIAVAVFFNGGY
jgi:hypothetical protein